MIFKERIRSDELHIFERLSIRTRLTEQDLQLFSNLKKGYQGERLFDTYLERLRCDCLVLNDLVFKVNNKICQIDSLIITVHSLLLFEIKNYEGDYYYKSESDQLFKKPDYEITNPLNQLNRTATLFRQHIKNLGFSFPVTAFIVFVHPEFTMYQSLMDKPFIFPTQIKRFFSEHEFNCQPVSDQHKLFAEKLVNSQTTDSFVHYFPSYTFEELRKGITCKKCNSFMLTIKGRKCICKECGEEEIAASAIYRSIKEYLLLFPDRKLTTPAIAE